MFLEFSSSEELKRLRHSPILREHFEQILSPRHVYIETQKAPRLMKLLEQRGMYARHLTEEGETASRQRTYFHSPVLSIPGKSSTPLPDMLSEYQRLQQALDILYHAPGGLRPEHRRITPLLMEERRGQVYQDIHALWRIMGLAQQWQLIQILPFGWKSRIPLPPGIRAGQVNFEPIMQKYTETA